MPRDSSGNYTLPESAFVNGNVADADDVNSNFDDLGDEITASLEASGKKTWTGTQNANGYGIKTLANTKVHTLAGGTTAYTLTTGASFTALSQIPFILVKPNATNTGSSTLNIDSIGATTIKKAGANLASGEFVQDKIYALAYDGTNFNVIGGDLAEIIDNLFQPLDATLTALAALSWSSGNALVQFTAADTVSLTLAPSVTSLTATETTASSPAGTFKNTADNANNRALRIESDRATPANNDGVIAGFYLSDSAGNQDEFGRISVQVADVTSTSEDGNFLFGVAVAGTLTNRLGLTGTALYPVTNDALALGTTSLGWADLHLASGGVLNWANGLVTLTHDATNDCLDVSGGGFVADMEQVTGVGGETLTSAHRDRQLVLDGDITLPNSVFAAGQWQVLVGDGTDRTITRGSGVTMYVNGTDSATATLPARTVGGVLWETASVCHLVGSIS